MPKISSGQGKTQHGQKRPVRNARSKNLFDFTTNNINFLIGQGQQYKINQKTHHRHIFTAQFDHNLESNQYSEQKTPKMFSRNDRKWSSFRLKPKKFNKPQKINKTTETLQDYYPNSPNSSTSSNSPNKTHGTAHVSQMDTFYPTPIATPQQKSTFYTGNNYEISAFNQRGQPHQQQHHGGSILRNCSETNVRSKKSVRINENIESSDCGSSCVMNENIILNASVTSIKSGSSINQGAFSPRRMRWCENT